MRFKLIYENHHHYGLHVSDIFLMIKYGLESIGHVADIEHGFVPGCMNIMLECFSDEFIERLERSWTGKTGLIVIATEFLTGNTFNDIYNESSESAGKDDHNQRKDYWRNRYQNFVRILPYVKAIWHPAQQQVSCYRDAFPGVDVQYIPHVYSERFSKVKHRVNSEKDIDVLFTGTLTRYRKEIIESLKSEGLKVHSSSLFTAPFHREDLISRSKIVLNIKQHEDWEHESVGRLHYHISNNSLLITDRCRYPTDMHEYTHQVNGSWVETVKAQLVLGDYNERARAIKQQFSVKRPATLLFSELLQKCGIA